MLELEQGNFCIALKLAQQAVEVDPNDPFSLIARGDINQTLGNIEQTKIDLDQSMQIVRNMLLYQPSDIRLLNLQKRIASKLEVL